MAGEVLEAAQASVPGAVGDEESEAVKSRPLAIDAGDDAQHALAGEVVKAGGRAGDTEIGVARGNRDRDGLRRIEEDQLRLDPLRREIALVARDRDGAI